MAKINLLSSEVYNRIAAGEVVERPSSVVKELVENSIDAGATSIVVEIKRGGKDSIKVSDNGCGIEKDEMKKAFCPHATSKIANTEDLDAIGTLGFRGEALASIASVATVSVTSKPDSQEMGAKLTYDRDQPVVVDAGSPNGTYFVVEALFANIPARLKFMDKDFQEEAAITDLMSRLILSNPEVAFRYLADGKKIYQSYGQGLKDALVSVYGSSVLEQVIELNVKQGEMKLYGFIGRESFSKPNRTYQTLLVNRRYVFNSTVSNAVYYAYADRLMKRQFPFYVLYLDLPNACVDVNVHPNKLDVRFVDKNTVYSLVNVQVALALSEGYRIPSAETVGAKKEENGQKTPYYASKPINYVSRNDAVSFLSKRTEQNVPHTDGLKFAQPNDVMVRAESLLLEREAALSRAAVKSTVSKENVAAMEQTSYLDRTAAVSADVPTLSTVVGIVFDTYLIVQIEDTLYWIDQHAAHERLLYDRIKADRDGMLGKQDLLLPYVFTVNADEDSWLQHNVALISECGIDIESFGERRYKISSLPVVLMDLNLSEFLRAILVDVTTSYRKKGADLIKDKLMQEACKAAVKGGDKLTEDELAFILRKIHETNATLMCPHGRPIVVKVERTAVEKWFKRIVS